MVSQITGLAGGNALGNLRQANKGSDGTLNADSFDALSTLVAPADNYTVTESNNRASEVAPPTPPRTLSEITNASTNNVFNRQDTVEVSEEAVIASGQATITSQNLAQKQNADTATTALGNTVDVET